MVVLYLLNAAAGHQPWRCLWRGSVQITRTTPLRRMTLQLRHIFLTDAATFIVFSFSTPVPVDVPSAIQIRGVKQPGGVFSWP
jgi:hypothetical protein